MEILQQYARGGNLLLPQLRRTALTPLLLHIPSELLCCQEKQGNESSGKRKR